MRHVVLVQEEPAGPVAAGGAAAAARPPAGFAVMARGLHEYEAVPAADGVDLAVTLLRCVGWLSRDDLVSRPQGAGPAMPVPEAQCPGPHRFELAVMPFAGPYWQSPLLAELDAFVAPPMAQAVAFKDNARGRGAETLGSVSFLEVSPPLLLSAFKPADDGDGAIVRVWNPAPEPVEGWIRFPAGPAAVYEVRLDETRLADAPLVLGEDGRLAVTMDAGGVRTYRLAGWRLGPRAGAPEGR